MSNEDQYKDMSEQEDLSLPDQEKSWQKMKHLLEEDDRKRPVLPPGMLRSCAGWGLLAAGILAVWFFANPEGWFHSEDTAETEQVQQQKNEATVHKEIKNLPPTTRTENTIPSPGEVEEGMTPSDKNQSTGKKTLKKPEGEYHISSNPHIDETVRSEKKGDELKSFTPGKEKNRITRKQTKNNPGRVNPENTDPEVNAKESNPIPTRVTPKDSHIEPNRINSVPWDSSTKAETQPVIQPGNTADAIPVEEKPVVVVKDSTAKFDSSALQQPASSPLKKRKFFVTAGLGLQQQIRLTTRDSMEFERKTSLADYVPSVYVRLHKEDKWFLQGEFRYGAPQSIREFSYSRQTKYDSDVVTTTTLKLKKTYYHQLPLSFNYYLRPNLSVGAGAIYSRFYRAVTEQEIKSRNLFTQSETVAKKIVEVPHFTDSFFYKTQVHFLLQADYEWRRFSVGMRYTKDMQPYIKYTQPDGRVNEEKNQTFQILLRYRLWKSKRFNINI